MKRGITHLLPFNLESASGSIIERMHIRLLFFYGRGVTITKLADMVGKARNTIQKRLDSMPVNHLIVEKKGKTNFYKLDLLMFKESGSRRPV